MIQSIDSLVAFLKRFHRHWLDDPSLDPSLIPGDLPDGLAAIYRELGALVEIQGNGTRAPFAAQDALMPLSRLQRVEGMIEFAWENQGNWSARCPLGQSDPPVYSNAADAWESVQQGFVIVCDSLNHFLATLCLQEAVMGCCNLVGVRTDQAAEKVLVHEVQPLWLNGHCVFRKPSHQFHVSADGDMLVMNWAGVWVGSPIRPVGEEIAYGFDTVVISGD